LLRKEVSRVGKLSTITLRDLSGDFLEKLLIVDLSGMFPTILVFSMLLSKTFWGKLEAGLDLLGSLKEETEPYLLEFLFLALEDLNGIFKTLLRFDLGI
jgi:hypothetical protein